MGAQVAFMLPAPLTMAARVRWQGTTAARGYGSPHQLERKRRLTAYRPGDRCAMGGEPLPYHPAIAARLLDLAHDHTYGGYLPGLACRRHNRGEGATRGNRKRARTRFTPAPPRRW